MSPTQKGNPNDSIYSETTKKEATKKDFFKSQVSSKCMDSRDAKMNKNIDVFGKPNVLITPNPAYLDHQVEDLSARMMSQQSQIKDSTFSKLREQLEKEHALRNQNEYNYSAIKHSKLNESHMKSDGLTKQDIQVIQKIDSSAKRHSYLNKMKKQN